MALNVLATGLAVGAIVELINEDGAAQGFIVQADSGGGTLTPLSDVAIADANSTAVGTPDGSIANPFLDIQDAIDAGFVTVLACPGNYGNISFNGQLTGADFFLIGLGSPTRGGVSTGNITNVDVGSMTFQNCSTGQIDDSGGAPSTVVQLLDVTMSGNIIGSGTTIVRTGSALQNTNPGFEPVSLTGSLACGPISLAWTRVAGDLVCTNLNAIYSRGAGVVGSGVARLDHCTFNADVLFGGAGLSTVRDSTINVFACDLLDARDSTINTVSGDTGGGLVFRNCVVQVAGNPITCDGATELKSLQGGITFTGDRVLALEQGQHGDAILVTGNATLTCAGQTRALVPPDLGANVTALKLDETGGGAFQDFAVDMWATAHTVQVQDSAGTNLGTPLPAQAAGTGTRYLYQIDSGTGLFVRFTFSKLGA